MEGSEQKEKDAIEKIKGVGGDGTDLNFLGVGVRGRGKDKGSSSSGKPKELAKPVSNKRITKGDAEWPKDLPDDFEHYKKDWFRFLSAAISQGKHSICWAIAIAKCIQALFAMGGVRVVLSPQHLINNIMGKSNRTGHIIKYEELSNFLINQGLVLEEACPFTGKIDESCPKTCSLLNSDESFFKIKEFNRIEEGDVKEQVVLRLVDQGPVVEQVNH